MMNFGGYFRGMQPPRIGFGDVTGGFGTQRPPQQQGGGWWQSGWGMDPMDKMKVFGAMLGGVGNWMDRRADRNFQREQWEEERDRRRRMQLAAEGRDPEEQEARRRAARARQPGYLGF